MLRAIAAEGSIAAAARELRYTPNLAATVNGIGTAIGLVGIGWGITVAPELTPRRPDVHISRIPIAGVDTERHSVLIVRDGEHESPRIAAAIQAVRTVSTQRWPGQLKRRGASSASEGSR